MLVKRQGQLLLSMFQPNNLKNFGTLLLGVVGYLPQLMRVFCRSNGSDRADTDEAQGLTECPLGKGKNTSN